MDGHGALKHVVRHAGVHHVDHAVNGFVAAGAEDGGAENLSRGPASTTTFMKPCVSSFSTARLDAAHRPRRDQQRPSGRARLRLGDADPAERRIDVQRVGWYPLPQLPVLAVEQVGGNDLEVVVRRVREGAAAVAVAERPDARARWWPGFRRPRCSRARRSRRPPCPGPGRRCSVVVRRPAGRAIQSPRARPPGSRPRPRHLDRVARG